MILYGTLVNVAGVLGGGLAGLVIHKLLHRGIPPRYSERVMQGIGLCTVYIAATSLLDGSKTLVTVLSMVFGAAIGELLDLDGRVARIGQKLEAKFGGSSEGSFVQGFLSATLLFCVGTMAILGSLDAGLRNDHATLLAKAVIDTISSCVFASTLGLGVLFSAVPLFLYQGGITLLSSVVGPYLTEGVIAEMNTVGSLLLLGLSLDLLGIKKLKLMNYIPAIFLPILFYQFF